MPDNLEYVGRLTINIKNSSFEQGCVGEVGMRRTINIKNPSFDQGCVG